jgi:hypothetical protein
MSIPDYKSFVSILLGQDIYFILFSTIVAC